MQSDRGMPMFTLILGNRLSADATAILQQHAGTMKKRDGNSAVLLEGYADQHGPAEYNRTLALRRAESVKQFLVELGVPESSMKVVSLGKEAQSVWIRVRRVSA